MGQPIVLEQASAGKLTTDRDAVEREAPPAAPPPHRVAASVPNGGLQAWLQVAGSFCLYFGTWGKIDMTDARRIARSELQFLPPIGNSLNQVLTYARQASCPAMARSRPFTKPTG